MHGRGGRAGMGNVVLCCLICALHSSLALNFFSFFFAMLDIASVKTPPRLAALGWLSPPVCVISVFAEHVSFHNIARITRGGKSRAVDSAGRVAGMLCLRFKGKTGLFRDFGFHGKTKMLYVQVSKR